MAQQLDVRYVNYYSSGSSALKVAPAAPAKVQPLPRKQKVRRLVLRLDPIACVGIVLATVMTVLIIVGVVNLNAARQEADAMASYVNALEQENAALKAEFEEKCDLEEVRTVALALGMVPMDQVEHVTIDMPAS